MAKNENTSLIIDSILKTVVVGGALSVAVLAPNILKISDRPLNRFLKTMDERSYDREIRRVLMQMKKYDLITSEYGYDHGIKITDKGRQRLKKANLDYLVIPVPKKWDRKWRLVFYDIPEKNKTGRDALTRKLKNIGFYQLQKSVFVHPFPCREEILRISSSYGINDYVSYIETDHIDQGKLLMKKFKLINKLNR